MTGDWSGGIPHAEVTPSPTKQKMLHRNDGADNVLHGKTRRGFDLEVLELHLLANLSLKWVNLGRRQPAHEAVPMLRLFLTKPTIFALLRRSSGLSVGDSRTRRSKI